MTPEKLWKESAKRAAKSGGVTVTGAVSLLASAILVNPLPLILWGIGSAGWVLHSATSPKRIQAILDEEKRERRDAMAREHEKLRSRVISLLQRWPFAIWFRKQELPDYLEMLTGVEETCERIIQTAHDRQEVEMPVEKEIVSKVAALRLAFLTFLEARVAHLQILTGVRIGGRMQSNRGVRPTWKDRLSGLIFQGEGEEGENGSDAAHVADVRYDAPPYDLGAVANRIAERRDAVRRASESGSAAAIRSKQADVLDRYLALLRDIKDRDERIAAQLDMIPDSLAYMLARVSAAQFDASEVTDYMTEIATQVDETARLVEDMRPRTEDMLRDAEFDALVTA